MIVSKSMIVSKLVDVAINRRLRLGRLQHERCHIRSLGSSGTAIAVCVVSRSSAQYRSALSQVAKWGAAGTLEAVLVFLGEEPAPIEGKSASTAENEAAGW